MRVLVTGGAGFIGRHVSEHLVAAGHEVRSLDLAHPAAHRRRPEPVPGTEALWGDLADPDLTARAVDGIDAVSHQAAMVGLGVDFGDVRQYVHHNDLATAVLLEALHHRAFTGRIVLASSMVVYGEGRYRCEVHGAIQPLARPSARLDAGAFEVTCARCSREASWEPVDEDTPLDPRNTYAATKVHQEHLLSAFEREHHGVDVVTLRYHNVYGPGMPRDTPYAGVASIFRSAVERGEPPTVLEDGGQTRDFVHVSDVARANVLALTVDGARGACNLASGEPRTILDLATALASGRDLVPQVTGGYRLGDVRHVVASPARAARNLGFRAEVSFEDGMASFRTDPLR